MIPAPNATLYHFLFVPPALGADWLFGATRRYWEHFRPIVIDVLDIIAYVPEGRPVTVTILARRDLATQIVDEVRERLPDALLDPLVYDAVADMRLTLDGRAAHNQRLGLPEAPTPTLSGEEGGN